MFVCRSVRKCVDSVEYEQTVLFLLLTGLRTIKLCWQQLLLLLQTVNDLQARCNRHVNWHCAVLVNVTRVPRTRRWHCGHFALMAAAPGAQIAAGPHYAYEMGAYWPTDRQTDRLRASETTKQTK